MNAPLRHDRRPDLRPRIEQAIEKLIAALDALDAPDDDIEEDHAAGVDLSDDEPSLGSLDGKVDQRAWSHGSCNDAEEEYDGREPEEAW